MGNEVVAAFGFGFSFWLHQGGIPHRMGRFYLLLAGAGGKRQGIALAYPSPTPLLTPWGIRCGGALLLPRLTGISDSGIRCRFLIPTSIYRLGALCSALYRSRFSRGAQLGTFVFHYWGRGCSFLRLRGVGLSSCVGFGLTANGSAIWRMKGRNTESFRSISNMV